MKLLAGLLALIGPAAPAAAAADQHQHGVASLRIVVEADMMSLRLRVPLESLAGFEAAPRTAKQRQALKDMAAKLREAQWLFAAPVAAECVLQEIGLASDAVSPALLAARTDDATDTATAEQAAPAPPKPDGRKPAARRTGTRSEKQADPAEPVHADLEAAISFRCANPRALTGLQVRLFDAFPRLRQIDAEILTPRGESGARLSPNRTGLTW